MIPWTGLGAFSGYRGDAWLKNRIQIFEQFVLPSLLSQTSKNFIIWCAWRYEEKSNRIVQEFIEKLNKIKELRFVQTYSGCPMYDDKYPDSVANERLISAIHGASGELINTIGENDFVYMTINASDDIYFKGMVEEIQKIFAEQPDIQVITYKKGYIMDYLSGKLAEWNPKTNPPFFTIKFPHKTFIDPFQHTRYANYKSHEYIEDNLKSFPIYERSFLVGTHLSNISTVFDHPFAGNIFTDEYRKGILKRFGLTGDEKLIVKSSLCSIIFNKMPYKVKRKLRYLASEKDWVLKPIFSRVYNFLRS